MTNPGTPRPGGHRTPDLELLAAYLDGEFEGRDGVEDLRRQVECWLETNPDALRLARDYRRLRRTWSATSPPEPSPPVWDRVLTGVRREAGNPARPPARRRSLVLAFSTAVAACLAALVVLAFRPPAGGLPISAQNATRAPILLDPSTLPTPEDDYVLPVARAEEVTILQVDGDDTASLVVARPPVLGVIELVRPEDVTVTHLGPATEDGTRRSRVRVGERSPMIWLYASSD